MNQRAGSDPFQLQMQMAAEHERENRPADARRLYDWVLARNPSHAQARLRLGSLLHRLGDDANAVEHLQAALQSLPREVEARYYLGISLSRLRRPREAAAQFEAALGYQPQLAEAHNQLGIVKAEIGLPREAERHLLRAIRLRPGMAEAHKNLGTLYSELGRFDEARAALRKAIACNPDYGRAYWHLASLKTFTEHDDDLRAMEALHRSADIDAVQRMELDYGLGKAFHELHQYPRAFACWREGNELRRRLVPYKLRPVLAEMRAVKRLFSAGFCSRNAVPGASSPTPVFIVGMPRSGTSLVEQILASHSAVFGGGELNSLDDCIRAAAPDFPRGLKRLSAREWEATRARYLEETERLSGGARVVTDKMPANFLHVGAIHIMFADARIIHCRRDALDTGLSCYRTHFVSGRLGFTCDLKDLGAYYRGYRDLMQHWHGRGFGNIHDIDYESLIGEPESAVRRLLEFCGLPFEPGCLQFHRNKRAVKTASGVQVRKPIYRDSVQVWRHYEKELRPLQLALLGPWRRLYARLTGSVAAHGATSGF